jgi:hypothetical protein
MLKWLGVTYLTGLETNNSFELCALPEGVAILWDNSGIIPLQTITETADVRCITRS